MKVVRLTEDDLKRIVKRVISEQVKEVTNFDKDYDYKKVSTYPGGMQYFFKLKPSPVSEKAKGLKSQGKFKDWTEATGAGLEAIKTKVFKDAPTTTTTTTTPPKPTTSEPQTSTPEIGQVEKTNVAPLKEPSVAVKPQSGQVQRQAPSQIPPLTASQNRKVERMANKNNVAQSSAGQLKTYDF